MNKQALVDLIRTHLTEELAELQRSAGGQELPADTRNALRERAAEVERQILMFRFLPVREFGDGEVVCPAALVELELQSGAGIRAFYLVTPQSGGLVTSLDGRPVQVVSPQSPIGEAILGKKVGDLAEVAAGTGKPPRRYKILSIR